MITVSHNQPMPEVKNGVWVEYLISGCPNGCKIYRLNLKVNDQWELQNKYVYAHNSNYGCKR